MSIGSHWFIFTFVSVLHVCNRFNDSCLNLYPCVITFGQSLSQSTTKEEINGKKTTTTYQRNRRRMLRRYDPQRNDVWSKSRSKRWWCQWRYERTCWQRNGKHHLMDCFGSFLSYVFHIFFFFFGNLDLLARAATSIIFVATNTCLSQQNTSVVATKVCLPRQVLSPQNCLSRQEWYLWQLSPMVWDYVSINNS